MQQQARPRFRRWQLLSNPRVQLRIIYLFGWLALLFAGTNYYIAKSTLKAVAAEILRLPLSNANRTDVGLAVRQQATTLDVQMLLFTLLSLVTLLLAGLVLSHHIGGPIHQLTTYLKGVVAGKAPREIHFRRHDFFNELAESFNLFQRNRGILPPENGNPSEKPSGTNAT